MMFRRARGIAIRATAIRVAVELTVCLAAALAVGRSGLASTTAALMIALYGARAVLWLVRVMSSAIVWWIERRATVARFAEALGAVDLPVTADMRGEADVTRSLGRALLDPDISRAAAAFAYSTQGYVEAVHQHCDPVVAAMITSSMARGMDRHVASRLEAPHGVPSAAAARQPAR